MFGWHFPSPLLFPTIPHRHAHGPSCPPLSNPMCSFSIKGTLAYPHSLADQPTSPLLVRDLHTFSKNYNITLYTFLENSRTATPIPHPRSHPPLSLSFIAVLPPFYSQTRPDISFNQQLIVPLSGEIGKGGSRFCRCAFPPGVPLPRFVPGAPPLSRAMGQRSSP